ncbi:MAG: hypothetical protein U0361_24955, partial [Nitrospiraceae bacterium]
METTSNPAIELAAAIAETLRSAVGNAATIRADGAVVRLDDMHVVDAGEPAYESQDLATWARTVVEFALENAQDAMAEITTEPWPWTAATLPPGALASEPQVQIIGDVIICAYGQGADAIRLPD